MNINKELGVALENVKKEAPLIHCITNYVTANDCANVILALGGHPTMASAIEEVEEMASKASALVLNLGMLDSKKIESMIKAGISANKSNVPVILDPVGVGATKFRKEAVFRLIQNVKFSVIRGNIAEIKTLCGLEVNSKGVDSEEKIDNQDIKELAKYLAKKLDTVVVITGVIDYVSDGKRVFSIKNGDEMLTKITGAGCMTTSLIGTYLGGKNSPLISAIAGVATMGISGEMAKNKLINGDGSGTFRVKIIDDIYNFSTLDFEKWGQCNEEN